MEGKIAPTSRFRVNFIKVWVKLIQNNTHCQWIKIEESPENKFLIILKICHSDSFDALANDTKRNPWVMLCSYAQLMTIQLFTQQHLPCSYVTSLFEYHRG